VNILNNKCYIGKTSTKHLKYFKNHLYNALECKGKSTRYIYNSIRKNNPNNFKFEIIDSASSFQKLNDLEKYYIKYYNSYWTFKQGYNLTWGGDGVTNYLTTEVNNKISITVKKHFETHSSPFKGQTHTPEVRAHISFQCKKYWKEHPERTKEIQIKRFLTMQKNGTNIRNRTDVNEIISLLDKHKSIVAVCRKLNVTRDMVVGKLKSVNYFIYEYYLGLAKNSKKDWPIYCITNGTTYTNCMSVSEILKLNYKGIMKYCDLSKPYYGYTFKWAK
jgi:group I intron endonuclease